MGNRQQLRIALAQLTGSDDDVSTNVKKALAAIEEAAGTGADLVILPEIYLTGFPASQRAAEVAFNVQSGTEVTELEAVRDICISKAIGVVVGFAEGTNGGNGEGGRIFNTTIHIDRTGKTIASYRKTHLFTKESETFSPGDHLVRYGFDLETNEEAQRDRGDRGDCGDCGDREGQKDQDDQRGLGSQVRAGILVCYDIEFPETARALAETGLDLLIVPSANMDTLGDYHRAFIKARAIENHAFVAYCNRLGEGRDYTYVGHSRIVSPFGQILADASQEEQIVVATLDLGEVQKAKEAFNYLKDRRPRLPVKSLPGLRTSG